MACDLEPWHAKSPLSAENVARVYLEERTPAYFSVVEVMNVQTANKENGFDEGKTYYELKAVKRYAGAERDTVSAFTDNANSCALSAKKGDRFLLHVRGDDKTPYEIYEYNRHYFFLPEEELIAYLDAKPQVVKTK